MLRQSFLENTKISSLCFLENIRKLKQVRETDVDNFLARVFKVRDFSVMDVLLFQDWRMLKARKCTDETDKEQSKNK